MCCGSARSYSLFGKTFSLNALWHSWLWIHSVQPERKALQYEFNCWSRHATRHFPVLHSNSLRSYIVAHLLAGTSDSTANPVLCRTITRPLRFGADRRRRGGRQHEQLGPHRAVPGAEGGRATRKASRGGRSRAPAKVLNPVSRGSAGSLYN